MDNQQATAFELGWLVGAIDGEGCVGITRRNRKKCKLGFSLKPHVQISNCDLEFIDRCCFVLNKLNIPYHISHYTGKGRRRNSWQITIAGLKRVMTILPTITNLLCDEKQEKSKLVIEYCESRLSKWASAPFTKRELEIYAEIADLNVKGRKALSLRDYTPNSYSTKLRFKAVVPTEDIVQTTTQ